VQGDTVGPAHLSLKPLPSPRTCVLRVRYGKYKIVISRGKRIETKLMMEMEGSQVACGIVLSVANTEHSPNLHIKFPLRVLHVANCSDLSAGRDYLQSASAISLSCLVV
jgi:hypothetical protein